MSELNPTVADSEKARILLVDDHPVLRQGLSRVIEREPDMTVCGEAESVDEALDLIESAAPALAVVDLSLQGKPGLELVKLIRRDHPETRVLVLSMHDEALWAERVLRAGACGYVMKKEKPRVLMAMIRRALKGERCLSERMSTTLQRKLTSPAGSVPAVSEDALGDRELQVLQLIGQGRSTRDIAAALHVSVKTVEAHREHIKHKLNLESGNELIRYAVMRFMGE